MLAAGAHGADSAAAAARRAETPQPQPAEEGKAPRRRRKPKPPAAAKKPAPAATPKPAATPAPTATVTPAPAFEDPNVDLVYGAYQRGQYKTAFDLATNRAQFNGDPKAMTMLGELYANAHGRQARLRQGRRMVQARRRRRRPRGHVRAGDDAACPGAAAPVNREEAVKLLASVGQARQSEGGL